MQSPRIVKYATAIVLSASTIAYAGDTPEGQSVTTITPIFSQLLAMTLPAGFKVAFQDARGSNYIQEAVPAGETVNNWTQMITVTGVKDLATRPELTPRSFLNSLAQNFQRACPGSFSAKPAFQGQLSGFDAFVGVVSCGTAPTPSGKSSESALIAVIKGQSDFYTIQWAERAAPSETPIEADMKKWGQRFKALSPIKLCSRVPGEAPPYPSCLGS